MGVPLFLVPELPSGDTYRLTGPEGHHASRVQRLTIGEELMLADGAGGLATCRVTGAAGDGLDLEVVDRRSEPVPDPRLTVAQALAKGDRAELAVQAMTEVGVDTVVPWSAARCVVRWHGERGNRALQRWRSVAREAAKQSRRAWVPEVTELEDTPGVCRRIKSATAAYLLHEEASHPLATVDPPGAGEIILVVGPEGGIAPEELELFVRAGGTPVRLGRTVLRTSTAGVAALAVLSARLGRWE